ncbi:MAG TPA: HEAT repeat domain-containing protein [Gemmataceae bacterium]|nr:HEAT repeat domain-containing protein [Gemmataceae bacterium]
MKIYRIVAVGTLALLGLSGHQAQAGHGHWGVGINIGGPVCYHPWGWDYGYYYRPYPVYVAPPPVIIQSAPVLQPVPVAQPVYQAPPPRPVVAQAPPAADGSEADVERHLQLLADPDERVRADSVMQLGRMRAQRAVDPLAATLAGDRSPTVRDAAARALGLIGSPQAIPALQRAAQADNDRDVRHSAQFAIDVVQSNR